MAEDSVTLYECNNPACSLGTVGNPGHFTGGMTAEQVNLLTGTPVESLEEGVDYGESFCPNCGKQGTAVGEHSYSENAGADPTEGKDSTLDRLNALAEAAGLVRTDVWGEKREA